jgi:ClpP class serine protease
MKVFYAMERTELEKYYGFRDMESRLRSELSVELVEKIKVEARDANSEANRGPLYEVEDGVAKIRIEGTLEPTRSISASLFDDTTTYAEIEEATRKADADYSVKSIDYLVNSPGGKWDGADRAAETIKTAGKPTRAIVGVTAASAAYLLASQADKIFAETKGSMVGSIGVAAEYYDRTKENEQTGIRRVVFTNTASADKRPALETEEGAAVFTEQLDVIAP